MNEIIKLFTGDTWAFIDAMITLLTVAGVTYGVWDNINQKKQIKIYVERDGKKDLLPINFIRKNFTRAELFGVLGPLDKDSAFRIKSTSTKEFLDSIVEIQNGNKDELTIFIVDGDKFEWQ